MLSHMHTKNGCPDSTIIWHTTNDRCNLEFFFNLLLNLILKLPRMPIAVVDKSWVSLISVGCVEGTKPPPPPPLQT